MKRKLVLFGIDGGDWNIIDPLIAEGVLPNFKKAKEGGSHSELMSTIPALTAPAWRSIFTGVNPGKHGVFDFLTVDNGKIRLTTSKDTKVPYFWEDMGEKVLAFNIPCAFPIRKIPNTTMVSGFGTPSSNLEFTDPPELADEIKSIDPNYSFRAIEADLIAVDSATNKDGIGESIVKLTHSRVNVAKHLMQSRQWDMALIIFSATDWIQHYSIHDFYRNERKSDTFIAETYKALDAFLGFLMEKGYDVVVVSDHGFREVRQTFFPNSYLRSKGFLKLKQEPPHQKAFRKLGIFREDVVRSLPKSITKKIGPHKLTSKLDRLLPATKVSVSNVDISQSSAYLLMQSGCGVYIKENAEEIINALKEARDENGRLVVKAILKREEIYSGDYVGDSPHIVIIPEETFEISEKIPDGSIKNINSETEKTGNHRPQGIFLAYGSNLKPHGSMKDLSVLDIAPTILSYYGYEVPAFMDGEMIPVTGKGKKKTLKLDTMMKIKKLRKMK